MTVEYGEHDRERFAPEGDKREGLRRDEFVRDRARVLHSSALRRLAAKTQVVLVGESDFPRTRLTHSLECAQIGRELAASIGADPDIVDAACLAHDLGHPPFGHNGEIALDEFAAGIGGFEGNAQSLRVLTQLEAKVVTEGGRSAGLNLTRAVLDAATKYPWPRQRPQDKFGVYRDDLEVFRWLRDGSIDDRRCVEAQVMDWADDVAYSVHDVEDGVHAGTIDLRALAEAGERSAVIEVARSLFLDDAVELEAALAGLMAQPFWVSDFDGSMQSLARLKRLTSELTGRLCGAAIATTRAACDAPARRYAGDLVVPVESRAECAVLKAIATHWVMRRELTIALQERQREQLAELLHAVDVGAPETIEPWLSPAWRSAPDDAGRRRVVVDQVASLTDVSALAWHARLCT